MENDELNENIKRDYELAKKALAEVNKVIVGQYKMIERLAMGLLTGGHILLEGVPGLAKTMAIKTFSEILGVKFQRIQFTPDLLPADLIGTLVFNPKTGEFNVKKGPIFANIILADEINRAPSKVQSALLEAMQEHQVTIAENTYKMDEPFLVLATQNPIEQGGTYPLPEAQVDRFIMKVIIKYPSKDEERLILEKNTTGKPVKVENILTSEDIFRIRTDIYSIYLDDKIKDYILDIVFATRAPDKYNMQQLNPLILYGASPRATIALASVAKAKAFLEGRGYVIPDDVKEIAHDVLRHRIIVSYEAEAEEIKPEKIITQILNTIPIP